SNQRKERRPRLPIRNPQSAIRNSQSAIRNPQFSIRNPQSAIRNPQSAIRNPQSAIRNSQSPPPLPGLSIMDVCALSIARADDFFATLQLTDFQRKIAAEL